MANAHQPLRLTRTLRRVKRRVMISPVGSSLLQALALQSRHKPRRILLVSDRAVPTSEQQFAPLIRHATRIARQFGVIFHYATPDVARGLSPATLRSFAAVGLKLGFRTPAAEAGAVARALFEPLKGHQTRALVFDGDDDLCVLWPEVLALCDAYIKKHVHADLGTYGLRTVGKSNLTDQAHRVYGMDFSQDIIPASGGIAPDQAAKIVLGWNIALDDQIFDLSRDLRFPATRHDRYDLSCRASVPETFWTHGHRNAAVQAMVALKDKYRVHAPTDRAPRGRYLDEMLHSRMVVSPFGYGELCWRDFETILCGAVLVKPDTSHLRTTPDLLVPGVTYLPVAWDFSNLEEVCAPYLADETRRLALAQTARTRLLDALRAESFLDRLAAVLKQTGVT
jgi:hypothetical protein